MSAATFVFQLHHRESFERNVGRALAFGAAAGLPAYLFDAPYLVIAGASAAMARGDKMDRLLLRGLSLILGALPFALGLSTG